MCCVATWWGAYNLLWVWFGLWRQKTEDKWPNWDLPEWSNRYLCEEEYHEDEGLGHGSKLTETPNSAIIRGSWNNCDKNMLKATDMLQQVTQRTESKGTTLHYIANTISMKKAVTFPTSNQTQTHTQVHHEDYTQIIHVTRHLFTPYTSISWHLSHVKRILKYANICGWKQNSVTVT